MPENTSRQNLVFAIRTIGSIAGFAGSAWYGYTMRRPVVGALVGLFVAAPIAGAIAGNVASVLVGTRENTMRRV